MWDIVNLDRWSIGLRFGNSRAVERFIADCKKVFAKVSAFLRNSTIYVAQHVSQ